MGIGVVLVYHRIASIASDPWALCVTPQHFAEQLEVLRKHTRPMGLDEMVQTIADRTIRPRSVALTFDDGYSDNLQEAAPLLERHEVPATAFLATGYIGQPSEFWWDELERIFLHPIALPEELEVVLGGVTHRWQLDVAEGRPGTELSDHVSWRAWMSPPTARHKTYSELCALLRRLDHPERTRVLQELLGWAGLDPVCRPTHRPLTPEEVIKLHGSPLIDVGAHTVSHSSLSSLPVGRQWEEIVDSSRWLESLLGSPATSFAYPFGRPNEDYSAETVEILKEEGFVCGCTTAADVVGPDVDPFQLPRIHVNDLDGEEFERQLNSWLGDGLLGRTASGLPLKGARFAVQKVRTFADDPGDLWGANIDMPAPNVPVAAGSEIAGWVLGRSSDAVAVELVYDGEVVQVEPVGGYRPDVALAFPGVPQAVWCGFRFTLDAVLEVDIRALLTNRRTVPLTTIRPLQASSSQHDGEGRDRPLVSVVIPCYNHAHFLGEAIESVMGQTHRRIEIIVVDDGSTDNTSLVAARFPEVLCVRQENQGLAAARNTGLQSSRGEYVVFLDADDRLLPEAITMGIDALERHPGWALVSGHHRVVAADGTLLGVQNEDCWEEAGFDQLLRRNHIAMGATVMYRREALERSHGFDASLRACEDYDLYLRIARNSLIGCHHQVVADYRQHSANMTKSSNLMLKSVISVLNAERGHLRTPDHRRAFREGRRYWQDFYGRQLIEEIRLELGEGAWGRAARDLGKLARYHPLSLTSLKRAGGSKPFLLSGAPLKTRPASLNQTASDDSTTGLPRRLTPVSESWGFDRGRPVDRYYIESFLGRHADDVSGWVLEIGDNSYTRRFGGAKVLRSDVLNRESDVPGTTIVADLADAEHVPSSSFDCVILTQTLNQIYDTAAALRTLHRILAPGGVLLATVPGITRISQDEWPGSWYWGFTTNSISRLFEDAFGPGVEVESHGNVLTASAFLYGMATEELTREELDHRHPNYEVIVAVRACKALA